MGGGGGGGGGGLGVMDRRTYEGARRPGIGEVEDKRRLGVHVQVNYKGCHSHRHHSHSCGRGQEILTIIFAA